VNIDYKEMQRKYVELCNAPPQPEKGLCTVKDLIEYLQTLPPDTELSHQVPYGDYREDKEAVEYAKDICNYDANDKTLTF
jgi:hypothetical protein